MEDSTRGSSLFEKILITAEMRALYNEIMADPGIDPFLKTQATYYMNL